MKWCACERRCGSQNCIEKKKGLPFFISNGSQYTCAPISGIMNSTLPKATIQVHVNDKTLSVQCLPTSTIQDVCGELETVHGITNIVFVVNAEAYDSSGTITTECIIPMHGAIQTHLSTPMRILCLQFRETRVTGDDETSNYVDFGDTKIVVQTPWLQCSGLQSAAREDDSEMHDYSLSLLVDKTASGSAFYSILRAIQDCIYVIHPYTPGSHVNTDANLDVDVIRRDGFWNCRLQNASNNQILENDDLSEVLGRPLSVRGTIQCTLICHTHVDTKIQWVARSLQYRTL